MAHLQQGFLFDNRYRLLRKLGEGGYSEVWLVEDTDVRMEQVLKIFLPDEQLDKAAKDLFCNEYKLVYNLNHPNLLKYSYFGVCVGYPYLLMPYYDEGSAESLLGKCSETMAWRYLRDVAAGLAYLHSNQPAIIHQDIKPANVLLDNGSFIITDFGVSASVQSLLTGEDRNYVKGTRPYMPPEKFQSNPQIHMKNDIWSLGASLYELLTGSLPFGVEGGKNQLAGAVMPQRPANVSYDLWQVITLCLSRYPDQRPTAEELENYADKILNPGRQVSPGPSPLYNSGDHSTVVRPLYNQHSLPNQNYSRSNKSRPKKERNALPWLVGAVGVVMIAVIVAMLIDLIPNWRTHDSDYVADRTEESVKTSADSVQKTETTTVKNKPVKTSTHKTTYPSEANPETTSGVATTSQDDNYQYGNKQNQLIEENQPSRRDMGRQETIYETEGYGQSYDN